MEQREGTARRGGISLDALVLILVTGLTLHLDSFRAVDTGRVTPYTNPTLNAVAVGLLGLYLLVDVLGAPLVDRGVRARRLFYGGKGAVLAAILAVMLLWPTINMIGQRHATQPWKSVHDTSLNVEAATGFLLTGKDPYAQTYFNTPLAKFGWDVQHKYGAAPNPALYWTDTFPGQELVTVPVMLAADATLGWFDERFVYLLAFAAAVFCLVRLAPTPPTRLALVAAVTLNPLWITEFIYGQNDILVLAEILAVLYFSLHERWRPALLLLAVGCATKQTTLLLVPFYLWWLVLRLGATWRVRLERMALLLPWLVAPAMLMIAPFAFWNWPAFYNGNFAYVAGAVPHSYPIQGYHGWGAASFILWGGLVPGPNAYYPFAVLEAGTALPLAALLLRRMRPDTPVTVMLAAYATALFPVFYFSRFFHESYLAFTISLLAVAYFAHRPARRARDDGHLSFDIIVPLLLVPQLVKPPENRADGIVASAACGLLLLLVVVATLAPWGRLHGLAHRLGVLARAVTLAALAEVALFSRAVEQLTNRLRWNDPTAVAHDTGLQTWVSASALLKGHNPYTASFWDSALPKLYILPFAPKRPLPPDLPLTHNPHLPLGFLLSAPFQALFTNLRLLFDEDLVYVLAALVAIVLLALLVRVPARQLALLGAVVFSPLFGSALIAGQDDVLTLAALALGLLLLGRSRYLAASFAVGVALAFKLTAWPLIPLLLAYLAGVDRGVARSLPGRLLTLMGRSWGLLPPVLASTLPFILWNGRAFWDDAVAYTLGLMRDAVPLDVTWASFQTLGFGRVARDLGWARLDGGGYIGPWIGLGLGALALVVVAVRLRRAPSLPLLLAGYLVLLFVLEYFGRFMVDTSLGYLAALAPLSFFLPAPRPLAQVAPVPLPIPAPLAADESAVAV